MSEAKHSPLPWLPCELSAGEMWGVTSDMGGPGRTFITVTMLDWVAPDVASNQANAEFICRAVNNHEAMLAMLKELEACAAYWSEYDVPLVIVDRLRQTIADAERTVTP